MRLQTKNRTETEKLKNIIKAATEIFCSEMVGNLSSISKTISVVGTRETNSVVVTNAKNAKIQFFHHGYLWWFRIKNRAKTMTGIEVGSEYQKKLQCLKLLPTKIVEGPSAAPIIPIDPASDNVITNTEINRSPIKKRKE